MNSFGEKFKITLFGGSHTPSLGVQIDGVPSGMTFCPDDFREDIARRKSGAIGTTPRIEDDIPEIKNGSPLIIEFKNNNIRPSDYEHFKEWPRPGHADFISLSKPGQYSGRMTLPIVAAGVVAKRIISPIVISASLVEAGGISLGGPALENEQFRSLLAQTVAEGDSLGGVVVCTCANVPVGLGEPFFDSLESLLSHLLFSIPGMRGVEFGDGFAAAKMKGSEHNDCYVDSFGHTSTNGAGGINGGVSNGNPIVFRVAFKPTSSISKMQHSFNFASQKMEDYSVPGRHDTCFALRTPVIVESVAAIVLAGCLN